MVHNEAYLDSRVVIVISESLVAYELHFYRVQFVLKDDDQAVLTYEAETASGLVKVS